MRRNAPSRARRRRAAPPPGLLAALALCALLAACARPQPPTMSDPAARATLIAGAPTVTARPWETPPTREPTALPTPNLPTATPYATPRPAPDVYESVELGLRFELPFHWSRSSDAVPGAEVQLANRPNNAFLLIARSAIPAGASLEQAAPPVHAVIASWFSILALEEEGPATVGAGLPAWHGEYVLADPGYGVLFRASVYSVANGRQLISLIAYGEERHLRAEAATYERVFASLALAEPPVFGLPRAETYVYLEGESADPRAYDPAVGQGDRRVFGGLVSLDPQLRVAPALAESWSVSPDGTVYTFYLRPDARFHDGRPVTAQDVLYSWERAADPATGSPTVLTYLGDIAGAAERRRGEAASIAGLRALGERAVEVTLLGPRPYFLLKLTAPPAAVVDRANVAAGPDWFRRPNGTGPYRLISWISGKAKIYERSAVYAGEPPPVRYLVGRLDAPYGGLYAYGLGELDQAPLGWYERAALEDAGAPPWGAMREAAPLCTAFVAFDTARPPFDDPLVRQAFALAVDRERYAERALGGEALPARGLYPPGLPGHDPGFPGVSFDADEARRRLAASRYAGGALPPITLTTSGYGFHLPPGVGVLVQMWQEQLGVTIGVAQLEPAALSADAAGQERGNLFFWEWCADYPDPENFADALFHSQAQQNIGRYASPDLDALLERARAEPDLDARLALYGQAEALIVEDGAAIFLSHRLDAYLVAPRVGGAVAAPAGVPVERYLTLEAQP